MAFISLYFFSGNDLAMFVTTTSTLYLKRSLSNQADISENR